MGYTNTCAIPNVIRRGKNYYLHFRLSRNKFFRTSLSCDSATRARYITVRLGLFISLVKSARMGAGQLSDIIKKMKKLEQKDIDNYLLETQAVFYEAAKNIPAEVRASLRGGMSLSAEKSKAIDMSKMLGTTYLNDAPAILEDSVVDQLSSKYDISGREIEIDSIAAECDLLWKQVCDAKTAFLQNNHPEYRQILASLKPETPPVQHEDMPSQLFKIPTLTEAWGDFVKYKSSWNDKIRQTNEKYFEVIAIVLGKDTPVVEITRRDIKNLLEVVERLPRQNMKPYNRMTVQQCLDLDEVEEEDLVSSKTVRDYLKLCQGLFSTYLTGEVDVLESSPTNKIKYEAKSRSYGYYSHTEMRKLVEHFLTLDGWKKWVFLLLSYTGARRSEIAKLKVSDVRLDDDSQRYYIMIEDSKTEAGIRQVPIALRLIDMGFLDYKKGKNPNDKLFPEITYSNKVTRVFHEIREMLGIDYLDDYKHRRIVHSLRHTFVTEAQTKHRLTLIQQTIGHEHSDQGETQTYTGKMRVSALLPVVDSIDWLK
ncbi:MULTISPECIES: tyrosine-type recombinase/integrase [unclassified Serratia (in: enterobacteria)]|uniref:tyrosine-type recombinase/integrase n=1 Tax=unclassified Serratia (in: enterobacteria) TaxID=2647522 RepID=UPI00307611EE